MPPAAIVTGATGGLGYETAVGLARAGRHVILTGRNEAKGAAALSRLLAAVPAAQVEFRLLDVGSLAAVAAFAEAWSGPLDILVNNAAVMAYPQRRLTVDGFEAQFGTNYLGHFALTLRLLPRLIEAGGRVVSVSSLAHRRGRIDFEDLQGERSYVPFRAYQQSKLAMLIFARELQRRAAEHGWNVTSIAAHPGWSATNIVENGMGTGPAARLARAAFGLFAQSAAAGAQPILFAALDPNATPGGYFGPSKLGETRGPTAPSIVMPQAAEPATATRLWAVSEQLTGVSVTNL